MTNPEGFTPALEAICRERCAEFGEPPCWRLPELIKPCEHITPCEECLAIEGDRQMNGNARSTIPDAQKTVETTAVETDTPYTLRRTGDRRVERSYFNTKLCLDPRPPEHHSPALFQEHYVLEGRIYTSFWANKTQLPRAQEAATRELRHFLYRDFLSDLYAMERAIEEMDQDELRRICASMRDTVRGTDD